MYLRCAAQLAGSCLKALSMTKKFNHRHNKLEATEAINNSINNKNASKLIGFI